MEPLVDRAFLTLLLSPAQIEQLKAFELTLPPGRYMTGFEICRYFRLTSESISEQREAGMEKLLDEWQKINWKKNQIEGKAHEQDCHNIPAGQWCKCRTRQQEIHEWMQYVALNWFEPQPKRRLSDKIQDTKPKRYEPDTQEDPAEPEQSELDYVP